MVSCFLLIPLFWREKGGPIRTILAPEMTRNHNDPGYELLGQNHNNLPLETGLEVNEREQLEPRGPWGEGRPREAEGMGPDPDPLEQVLPDMSVVRKRDCEDT